MKTDIAIIGNPSCGASTLFHQMTGGNTIRGRYTARHSAAKEGPVKAHKHVNVVELKGSYSLSAYSPDDLLTREILISEKPDVIINVIDATGFERSLYLTLQLMELEIPMVIALNMMDEVRNNDIEFDLMQLEEELSIPVIPISASKNQGIHDLIHYALDAAKNKSIPKKNRLLYRACPYRYSQHRPSDSGGCRAGGITFTFLLF